MELLIQRTTDSHIYNHVKHQPAQFCNILLVQGGESSSNTLSIRSAMIFLHFYISRVSIRDSANSDELWREYVCKLN